MKTKLFSVFKNEFIYTFLFLLFYIGIFLENKAAIYFGIGFVVVFLNLLISKNKYKDILEVLVFLFVLILGLYTEGLNLLVGFLLGVSICTFLLSSYRNILNTGGFKNENYFLNATSLSLQVIFVLKFFFETVIVDVRGQNNLNRIEIVYYLIAFVISCFFIRIIFEKYIKNRLDELSYINLQFISFSFLVLTLLYKPFIEVGSYNIFLPMISTAFCILIVHFFAIYLTKKQVKFKKTFSSLAYGFIPLILVLFIPYESSKFLGLISVSGALAILNFTHFGKTEDNFNFRLSAISTFGISSAMLLLSIFSLNTKGIITKINIAEGNELISLITGFFMIYFFEDTKEAVWNFLKRNKLTFTYSLLMMGFSTLLVYVLLDLKGVNSLGSFLFGILGAVFIKNNFAYNKTNDNRALSYMYFENNLVNLLVIFAISLILVKS